MWNDDPEVNEIQRNIYKNMTPAEKWQVVEDLRAVAWALKAAGVRHQHPEWTETQIEAKVKEIFLYAST